VRLAAIAWVVVLAACRHGRDVTYHWDDRRVLCSKSLDDIGTDFDWDTIDTQLDFAQGNDSIAIVHAHKPGITVSLDAIERLLDAADERGLETITFRDLDDRSQPHGALAFAFDDNSPELWLAARDLFASRGAHITLFITRWATMTDEQHADIVTLATDGHDLEPHSVDHLNAVDYVAEHGIDAYLADEVLPSFTPLEQLGYAPTTFAYPFGAHDDEIDAAVLAYVSRVRAVGICP
jgi:hypothetical protein